MNHLLEKEGYKVETATERGCKFNVTVTLSPEQTKKAYKEAVKRINKEISIPGFRKGKAPDEAVIKQYAPHIEREWKEVVVNDAFDAALNLTKVYPYSKNTVEKPKIEKCSLEEGAVVKISYERYPEAPEVDFKTLSLPKLEKKVVSQEEVDAIVKEVRQSHANWEEITDRPVAAGDYIDLSIDNLDEDPPHPLIQKRRFEISDVMVTWLKNLILGKKPGDVLEGQTFVDDRSSEEEKKNYKPFKARVTIHAIQKILLPEVDDELAKKIGAENKEDLIAKIRANLERDAEANLREDKIIAMENLLLDQYPFDIPASILDSEVKGRIEDKTEELKKQNYTPEQLENERGKINEWAHTTAQKSLRLHFLLASIAEKYKVSLTQEELNEKLNQEILNNPYYHRLIKENNEMLQLVVRRLTTHFQHAKIKEWILDKIESA